MATPHPLHCGNALLALRAGKHVLVEKPFTMTAAEAREVAGAARDRGLFAMEAMWTRFLPGTAVIRDWLARGVLGDIVTVTADHGQWFAEDAGSGCSHPDWAAAPCSTSACTRCRSRRWSSARRAGSCP